jgi:hypothetical protein
MVAMVLSPGRLLLCLNGRGERADAERRRKQGVGQQFVRVFGDHVMMTPSGLLKDCDCSV